MPTAAILTQKDSLRIALEGVLQISWRLPTLPRVCSTIGVTGLNFSVRNGKRWNPGAITTRMGDMMNATLYLQTTNSLKKCAEETKPRGFYAMIYRSFLFSLIVFATRSEVRLTAYTGMFSFSLSRALPIYNKECAPRGFPTDAYLGQLVRLGFDIAVFTPASYLRHRL